MPSSAEKGQIPSSDETVNGLGVEKVERFTCRISVQGGVSERVRWVGRVNLKFCNIFKRAGSRYEEILHFRSVRPNVQGKAVTREATREAKMKRGGMKERFERNFRAMGVNLFLSIIQILRRWDSGKSFVGK